MITTGVTGQPWRASVTAWGSIEPWDDTASLNWFVAADDRWHVPADETSVRQRRIEGTAVTETRVRVPSGDVVQRIFSVADRGGLTIVEVENESTLPVAIAFDRRDVLTERPIVDVPVEGIDLPPGSFVMPLGHKASIRIAIVHGAQRAGEFPAAAPSMMQVVRGWLSLTERASRFVLPDGERGATLAEVVTAERCEIALGSIPRATDDAAGFVLSVNELIRMGEPPDHWMPELVDAVERVGPVSGWEADVTLSAAQHVLMVAEERRAGRDLAKIVDRRASSAPPLGVPDGVRGIAWLESRLALGRDLLPAGLPMEWLGQSLDVYGIPTVGRSTVSFAIRWHGARPAVLWEQTGEPTTLTASALAPDWRSTDVNGEALWPAPSGVGATIGANEPAITTEQEAPGGQIAVESDPDSNPGSFT